MNDLFIKDINTLTPEEAIDYSTYLGFVMDVTYKTNEQSFNILAENFAEFLKQFTDKNVSLNAYLFFDCCLSPYIGNSTWLYKIGKLYNIKPNIVNSILAIEKSDIKEVYYYGKIYSLWDPDRTQDIVQQANNNVKSNPIYSTKIKKLLVKLRIKQLEKDFM